MAVESIRVCCKDPVHKTFVFSHSSIRNESCVEKTIERMHTFFQWMQEMKSCPWNWLHCPFVCRRTSLWTSSLSTFPPSLSHWPTSSRPSFSLSSSISKTTRRPLRFDLHSWGAQPPLQHQLSFYWQETSWVLVGEGVYILHFFSPTQVCLHATDQHRCAAILPLVSDHNVQRRAVLMWLQPAILCEQLPFNWMSFRVIDSQATSVEVQFVFTHFFLLSVLPVLGDPRRPGDVQTHNLWLHHHRSCHRLCRVPQEVRNKHKNTVILKKRGGGEINFLNIIPFFAFHLYSGYCNQLDLNVNCLNIKIIFPFYSVLHHTQKNFFDASKRSSHVNSS